MTSREKLNSVRWPVSGGHDVRETQVSATDRRDPDGEANPAGHGHVRMLIPSETATWLTSWHTSSWAIEPSMMFMSPNSGWRCAPTNEDQEQEADWLTGCLFLPRHALLAIRRRRHHLGDSWKWAHEGFTSRPFCFTPAFPGSPNGFPSTISTQTLNPVHTPGITVTDENSYLIVTNSSTQTRPWQSGLK
jgi:hypothetical protein